MSTLIMTQQSNEQHKKYMSAAIEEAEKAYARDEVPIGAVLVDRSTGLIVARNGNRTRELSDPTAHAEVLVIRERCKQLGVQRIPDHDLYVTLEPCTQCAGAISFARIHTLTYAVSDPKGGAVESGVRFYESPTCHHRPEITRSTGPEACGEILRRFFKEKRK